MKLIDFLFGWIGLLWPSRKPSHPAETSHASTSQPEDAYDDDHFSRTDAHDYDAEDDDADSWETEEDMDHCYFDHDDHDDFELF